MTAMVSPDVRSMEEFEFDIPCVNDDRPAAFMGKGCADDCYHPICRPCLDGLRRGLLGTSTCSTCWKSCVRFEDHFSIVPI